ncbi:hypothetical protein CK203_069145 [Vitis vinifera]|uniref:Reverse transcriptase domain-containing protein n=1 Tax=Vitis vinifera TaxID=29760 RepID=A0A438C2B3_VITVI|nr:hypothetical protein CK203_069145 [Vitis vinifera]
MWLKEEGFKEKVQKWWAGLNFSGFESFVLASKLKALKRLLKYWNRLDFGKVEVKINGVWLTKENEVRDGVVNEFKLMMSVVGSWRPNMKGMSFERLEAMDAARPEKSFSEQEVLKALKEEVIGFFRDFHNHGCFAKSLNATFIVLIPKKGGAEDLMDYRPINLVGSLYKWLAKVLANRLKMVVEKVVSKTQNAFVEGRQILDVALVANEVLTWWMKWCISTISLSILVNGSSSGFFQSSRGLMQGDPLSLYLFVMIMEAFSSLLRNTVDGGFVSACKARSRGGEGAKVSHLIINLDESELILMGSEEDAVELVAAIGCKVGSLPTTYLGLPLGAPYRSLAVWDGVEERMRKKLARWKSQYISKGGRITLIQSNLTSGTLERKLHLVRWDLVCLEKCNKGGKYGEEQGGWSSKEVRGVYGMGLWKTLRKKWEVVKNRLFFVVGNWQKDVWVKDV